MPRKRSCASKACSLSRIVVICLTESEEVTNHLLENQFLETPEIEQAELQGLFDGGKERTGRVGAFQLEQTTQSAHTATVGTLLECGGIAFETSRCLTYPTGD